MKLHVLSLAVLAAAACLLATPTPTAANTLLVERVERAKASTLPRRGSTMTQVEAQYGEPKERFDAVGRPPITRWVYPAFTVYFEHSHVVNAVLNKSSATEEGPRPAPPQKPFR